MTTPAPGWYDDGSGTVRWWDGAAWRDQPAVALGEPVASAVEMHASPHPPGALVPQPYDAPLTSPGTNGLAIAGFVVGLVSVFLPLFLGLAGGITGLVLSIVGATQRSRMVGSAGALAVWGIVLSSIAIVFIL